MSGEISINVEKQAVSKSNFEHFDKKQFMYRIKPEELYILSYERVRGRGPRPFSQLRM